MAKQSIKTAVSLPVELYAAAEKSRRKTGMTRSAHYAAALRMYARIAEVREQEARYIASYRETQEDRDWAGLGAKMLARMTRRDRW